MCVLAEGFSMPLVVETLSTLAPGEWMPVVTMGLVTTAFCLWAEACALQNVDASVVAWHRFADPLTGCFMRGYYEKVSDYQLVIVEMVGLLIDCDVFECWNLIDWLVGMIVNGAAGENHRLLNQLQGFPFPRRFSLDEVRRASTLELNRFDQGIHCLRGASFLEKSGNLPTNQGCADLCLWTTLGSCLRIPMARCLVPSIIWWSFFKKQGENHQHYVILTYIDNICYINSYTIHTRRYII